MQYLNGYYKLKKFLNCMTKSFLFPETDSERALPAPNENGLRRCFSPGSFAVFEWYHLLTAVNEWYHSASELHLAISYLVPSVWYAKGSILGKTNNGLFFSRMCPR